MSLQPLQTIHDLGTRMHTALEAEDLNTFFVLSKERQDLIDGLTTQAATGREADWNAMVAALRDQQQQLAQALMLQETRLGDHLRDIARIRQARKTYRKPPRVQGRLRRNLRG